jgi:hypothetical protein
MFIKRAHVKSTHTHTRARARAHTHTHTHTHTYTHTYKSIISIMNTYAATRVHAHKLSIRRDVTAVHPLVHVKLLLCFFLLSSTRLFGRPHTSRVFAF